MGAGTGREGRKRRKSRNGCMVSTGFPVPPQELELHPVQIAPAPAPRGRKNQPNSSDLAAHTASSRQDAGPWASGQSCGAHRGTVRCCGCRTVSCASWRP
ncbi:hypothetical protein AV530_019431 [Patagioenas fasciata monilis]|uniref:Uncharacterized protein n=1 Tax=Patagioenas fasciata monilis TaxID=372326 RepID=A0A1V4JDS1_PATFA|nr:hypothetical protein AV530_019431 [Patagioenas fasciata monilis]